MKRVKVKVEHKRKLFYQKYLEACREACDDRNQQCTLYKAICGLRSYPLEVAGIHALKQIHGIGETFATRCESAWDQICAEEQKELSLADVLALTPDDYSRLLSSKNPKKKHATPTKILLDQPGKKRSRKVVANDNCGIDKTGLARNQLEVNDDAYPGSSLKNSTNSKESEFSDYDEQYVNCKPQEQAEVVLICDTREDRKKKFGYNVVDILQKNNNIRFETRVLSIGDFLWIARKIDGSELVMDWVVERKTWDDLESSIRHGRYDEQKQRLRQAPMNNKVYLLEDKGKGSVGAEQALSTTRSRDGFLIQRCKNGRETAMFLEAITHRITKILQRRTIAGVSFKYLQHVAEKGQVATVQNVWIQQLTVCPGMSSSKAQIIAECFPTIATLADHYAENKGKEATVLLTKTVPQITKPVSERMSKFFGT